MEDDDDILSTVDERARIVFASGMASAMGSWDHYLVIAIYLTRFCTRRVHLVGHVVVFVTILRVDGVTELAMPTIGPSNVFDVLEITAHDRDHVATIVIELRNVVKADP